MTEVEKFFIMGFHKFPDNLYKVRPNGYLNNSLFLLNKKAKEEEGKDFFYAEPIYEGNDEYPRQFIEVDKPRYRYHIDMTLSEEEFEELLRKTGENDESDILHECDLNAH